MTRRVLFLLLLVILVLWSVAPLAWQVITSLKSAAELETVPPLLPSAPTFLHYREVFASGNFPRLMLNSAIVAGCTTVLSLAIGSAAAFALAKLPVPFRGAIMAFILSASMFPPIATVSPLYLLIRGLGLRDTLTGLILTYTTFSLPLAVWILTRFFREIPDELYHAARVDGCTNLSAFVRIMLPLSAPGLLTTAILVFVAAWNEFLFALTFTATPRARTVPVGIALFTGAHELPWGELCAAATVVTLPLVAVLFVFQKQIVEGITSGAVKG